MDGIIFLMHHSEYLAQVRPQADVRMSILQHGHTPIKKEAPQLQCRCTNSSMVVQQLHIDTNGSRVQCVYRHPDCNALNKFH